MARKPEFLKECAEQLRDPVYQVWGSFSPEEKQFLRANYDRFRIACEADEKEDKELALDDAYGKVFINRYGGCEDFFIVNIWPSTLDEDERDIQHVIAHEFGHLFDLLAGIFYGLDESEERADEFAYVHGFPPKNIKPLTEYGKARAN